MFPAPAGLLLPCPICSLPEKPQGWDAFPCSSLAGAALDSAHGQLSVWWETQSFLGPEQRDNTRLRSWPGIPREGHHPQPPLLPLLGFPWATQPQSQQECCPWDPHDQPGHCHHCTGTRIATTSPAPWSRRAPQGTESKVEKAKPWMEPASRQTPVPANESGGWDR